MIQWCVGMNTIDLTVYLQMSHTLIFSAHIYNSAVWLRQQEIRTEINN